MPGTAPTLYTPWLWLRALLASVLLCLGAAAAAQTGLQAVPPLQARAMDLSATLSPQELAGLEAQLKTLEDDTGAQVVVLMLASTAPEDIAAYANRVAQSWKIGRKDQGDGVLIVVAKNDRRMRIEVARRLEGATPDIMAARIIDGTMKPHFRTGDYAKGLEAAVERLSQRIHGEELPAPEPASPQGSRANWFQLIFFSFIGFAFGIPWSRALFGKGLGSLLLGGGMGAMGYLTSGSAPVALATGLVAMLSVLLGNANRSNAGRYAGSRGRSQGKGKGKGGKGRNKSASSWHSSSSDSGSSRWSSSSSSSDWSSSSSDSFSSGGGGDFGGGGASGDW
ncbi:YgcG family protein [Comamonas sp. GB3 AK4-5]|uniref:TPM domain-containing protein n=1 Tax=Comamonas sp. GB3 AK4-5 TaxID=3231487 RepID=UPI00351DC431